MLLTRIYTICDVTRPGFEPRLAESESDVLPLHYRAMYFLRSCKLLKNLYSETKKIRSF